MRIAIAVFVIVGMSSVAVACDVDACSSAVGLSCAGMKISVCPQGDFEMIGNACGGAGAYIWVEIKDDCGGYPIAGIPPTDFWINACDPTRRLFLCGSPIVADSMTGADGRTTISGVFRAGGCSLSGGLWIACQGKYIYSRPDCFSAVCLNIVVKSPDLTGEGGRPDGIVNLSDLVVFGTPYNKNLGQAGYSACCDYTDDDKCNLSDFAYFGSHYQHRCE